MTILAFSFIALRHFHLLLFENSSTQTTITKSYMYKDIINYELAEGITEEHHMKVAGQILSEWMKDLDGFIYWEINKNKDGGYSDIVS
jgi:hypothetical protein